MGFSAALPSPRVSVYPLRPGRLRLHCRHSRPVWPERHNNLFAYVDDLIQLLQTLPDCRGQPVIYIGHSVSGMIGAIAAIAQPELFQQLILISASPYYLREPNYPGGLTQSDLDELFKAMATNYQTWAAGFAPDLFGIDDSALLADFSRSLFQLQPDIALRTLRMIFESDWRFVVGKIRTPVHLIQARDDFVVPQEVGLWLHEHIPGSTLDWVDARGHLPHLTHAADVCLLIRRFLPQVQQPQ
ncbi:alpha/beta hydrolase [Candidatus Igneacidithiobacillus taiwanensis]|uniref:alpha/beta fold hydrolase n=1 Tax=Candidatus Igneacidithiobacillus taiwanensis TaxID=1945924 RepID=UPI002899CCAE|nr:alpha/beta hydrolase [Candidatus Igneacidithiobacillus taiwanensis]MCE5361299.1 alpha/beta hydrolase [Acidithiobacillus sp.]